jgi:hypothetical protein
MLGTSTYAWFTMNRTVEVTGMEVRTKVGSNLLISTTNLDADYTSNTLSQTRKALLEPASSITGATGTFYYTLDAKASGAKNNAITGEGAVPYTAYNETAAVANAVAGKAKYDTAFNHAYGQGTEIDNVEGSFTAADITLDDTRASGSKDGAAYAYIDYTFYLKATSESAGQKVVMSKCDLDLNGAALKTDGTDGVDNDEAWRVAVYASDVTGTKPGTGVYTAADIAATAGNQKGLIGMAGASYFDGTAVSGTAAKLAITNNASSNGVVIGTVGTAEAPNATKYFKVVVRLWLEGEDQTCNSKTYAALTDDYALDLKFDLVDSDDTDTAVKNITTDAFDPNTTHTTHTTPDRYDATFGS